MTVTLHARNGGPAFRLNNLQVQLVASALIAVHAPDRELWAPEAYIPSTVCTSWSDRLFPELSNLVVIEVWDNQRAHLRPRGVVLVPPPPEGRRRKESPPDPYAGVAPYAERTRLMETDFGQLVLALATWWGVSGGCTVDPG
ncbi:MAG: hypothetical protein JWL64_94 [Frankiales bacterium]|nr:hypothetical protein [Frankiales bacterium]